MTTFKKVVGKFIIFNYHNNLIKAIKHFALKQTKPSRPYHISDSIQTAIYRKLSQIEKQHNVIIFYACESGSRAWGFSSVDSDYDVRFLYMHTKDWYLSIDVERRRDVIELPIQNELDINGWDLRKALKLLRKSNPSLLEWFQSPIIYIQKEKFVAKVKEIIPIYYSKKACFYHYSSMARSNFREFLKGEKVWLKKYFYVLRPILALQWIEEKNSPVPMKFETMANQLISNSTLKRDIQRLLAAKRSGTELQRGPKIKSISQFIEQELNRLEGKRPEREPKTEAEPINKVFRALLNENY